MENPWLKLNIEGGCYVLQADKDIINVINEKRSDEYKIRYNNLPTPFSGDFKNAKILLLQLNPGSEILAGLEPIEDHEFLIYKDLKKTLIKNLKHEFMEYPFFWLNPEFMSSSGFRYWSRIFSKVIKRRDDYKKISNRICCVQYFPYHSKSYKAIDKTILDSQNYGFHLVKEFIKKPDTLVVIMRPKKEWFEAVPELKMANIIRLKSDRNPILTKNNFSSAEDFDTFLNYIGVEN